MFGESQTSPAKSGTSRPILPFIGKRFLIKVTVKKIACLSVASLRFLGDRLLEISGEIRNLIQGNSLYIKKLAISKLLCPHSALGAARGCSGKGDWGNPVRDPAEGPLGFPQIRRGHVNDLDYY